MLLHDILKLEEKGLQKIENTVLIFECAQLHPRRLENGQISTYSCCCDSTGCYGCGEKRIDSEFEKYGLGVSIYFKSLKAFIYTLFVIVLINLFIYYVYFTNNSSQQSQNYMDDLFKTSLGNIGASKIIIKKYIIKYSMV
jgi:hypothetical protein